MTMSFRLKQLPPDVAWTTRLWGAELHGHSDRCSQTFTHSYAPVIVEIFRMMALQRRDKRGRVGTHVVSAWPRRHSLCSLSYAGTICHLHEHLQTQGALVTQC